MVINSQNKDSQVSFFQNVELAGQQKPSYSLRFSFLYFLRSVLLSTFVLRVLPFVVLKSAEDEILKK
jgi:hypothetical protein